MFDSVASIWKQNVSCDSSLTSVSLGIFVVPGLGDASLHPLPTSPGSCRFCVAVPVRAFCSFTRTPANACCLPFPSLLLHYCELLNLHLNKDSSSKNNRMNRYQELIFLRSTQFSYRMNEDSKIFQ